MSEIKISPAPGLFPYLEFIPRLLSFFLLPSSEQKTASPFVLPIYKVFPTLLSRGLGSTVNMCYRVLSTQLACA